MTYRCDERDQAKRHDLLALATDIQVRLLNVSAAGCLVETKRQLEVGTVATLRLTFAGGDFEDTVQVVRCQEIKGASVYQVGTTFLTTAAPSVESLRYLIRRESGRSSGYLRLVQ